MRIGKVSPQPLASLKLVWFDESASIAPAPARQPDQRTFVVINNNPGAATRCIDLAFAQCEMPGAIAADVRPLRIGHLPGEFARLPSHGRTRVRAKAPRASSKACSRTSVCGLSRRSSTTRHAYATVVLS